MAALKPPARTALVEFWEAWQDELATVRLLDPACGSGAFLIEAFDQLHAAYQASNDRLQELRGQRSLFDVDKRILEHNLYGVDLNEEAVEICRLSLWIKTACRGKPLTSLDHTIRAGNSIVRKLLAETSWIESVVDFGHAKQIFEDADVFPSIIVARKPAATPTAPPQTARLCSIPRDQLRIDDLSRQIAEEGTALPLEQLSSAAWQLEPGGVSGLLAKLCSNGCRLSEFAGQEPLYGIKTGCNEAFVINETSRRKILSEDPRSSDVMRPFFRGQDMMRWSSEWSGLWMLFLRQGIDINSYPAVKSHLEQYRQQLEPKPKGWSGEDWAGRKSGTYKWFEIQDTVDYWRRFDEPSGTPPTASRPTRSISCGRPPHRGCRSAAGRVAPAVRRRQGG